MRRHNYYKVIVWGLCMLLALSILWDSVKNWQKEEKCYALTVMGQSEWTEKDIQELKKIDGILKFQPIESLEVSIKLEGYVLETELRGIYFDEYHLKWKIGSEIYNMGNTPILFIGKDIFMGFSDSYGNVPTEGERLDWIENYNDVVLEITDEKGRRLKAVIGGILDSPGSAVFMDYSQMETVWGNDVQIREGYLEVYGYKNMKKAQEILMDNGYDVSRAAH